MDISTTALRRAMAVKLTLAQSDDERKKAKREAMERWRAKHGKGGAKQIKKQKARYRQLKSIPPEDIADSGPSFSKSKNKELGQQKLDGMAKHAHCEQCGRDEEGTQYNEGYSSCCNERICGNLDCGAAEEARSLIKTGESPDYELQNAQRDLEDLDLRDRHDQRGLGKAEKEPYDPTPHPWPGNVPMDPKFHVPRPSYTGREPRVYPKGSYHNKATVDVMRSRLAKMNDFYANSPEMGIVRYALEAEHSSSTSTSGSRLGRGHDRGRGIGDSPGPGETEGYPVDGDQHRRGDHRDTSASGRRRSSGGGQEGFWASGEEDPLVLGSAGREQRDGTRSSDHPVHDHKGRQAPRAAGQPQLKADLGQDDPAKQKARDDFVREWAKPVEGGDPEQAKRWRRGTYEKERQLIDQAAPGDTDPVQDLSDAWDTVSQAHAAVEDVYRNWEELGLDQKTYKILDQAHELLEAALDSPGFRGKGAVSKAVGDGKNDWSTTTGDGEGNEDEGNYGAHDDLGTKNLWEPTGAHDNDLWTDTKSVEIGLGEKDSDDGSETYYLNKGYDDLNKEGQDAQVEAEHSSTAQPRGSRVVRGDDRGRGDGVAARSAQGSLQGSRDQRREHRRGDHLNHASPRGRWSGEDAQSQVKNPRQEGQLVLGTDPRGSGTRPGPSDPSVHDNQGGTASRADGFAVNKSHPAEDAKGAYEQLEHAFAEMESVSHVVDGMDTVNRDKLKEAKDALLGLLTDFQVREEAGFNPTQDPFASEGTREAAEASRGAETAETPPKTEKAMLNLAYLDVLGVVLPDNPTLLKHSARGEHYHIEGEAPIFDARDWPQCDECGAARAAKGPDGEPVVRQGNYLCEKCARQGA